jgi:hypothetical protein
MMEVFGVYRNSDMTEGRGPMVLDGIYESEAAACEYAGNQPGVMGLRGPNTGWEVRRLKIITNEDLEQERRDENERAAVLARLSPRERRLLGIEGK